MSDPNTTAVRPVPRVGFATIVLGLIVLGILRWAYACYKWNQKYKLPARVPGIPILGNSLQVPAVQQGPWAKDLAAKYGEMYVGVPFPSLPSREDVELKHKRNRFTCQFGGSTWVFLNSSRVVKDLLEKRAAIYNSRPPFPMTQDIISRGGRIVLMPYGERWRLVRRVMHQILSVTNQPMFQPFQDLESRQLFWDYLHKPDRWFAANGRYANSVIMSVVFGRRSLLDDPDVAELFETIELFLAEQQPGVNLVNAFPVLANLPRFLQWWRPRGGADFPEDRPVGVLTSVLFLESHKILMQWTKSRVYKREVDKLEQRIRDGTKRRCFGVNSWRAKKSRRWTR